MSLKKLSSFTVFDSTRFFKNKNLMYAKAELWQEGEDRDHLKTIGTKITGVIFHDGTDYRGETGVNEGESIVFKITQPLSNFSSWKPFNTVFKVDQVIKAVVYGDYRNQLSITVSNLTPISGAGARKTGVK